MRKFKIPHFLILSIAFLSTGFSDSTLQKPATHPSKSSFNATHTVSKSTTSAGNVYTITDSNGTSTTVDVSKTTNDGSTIYTFSEPTTGRSLILSKGPDHTLNSIKFNDRTTLIPKGDGVWDLTSPNVTGTMSKGSDGVITFNGTITRGMQAGSTLLITIDPSTQEISVNGTPFELAIADKKESLIKVPLKDYLDNDAGSIIQSADLPPQVATAISEAYNQN